MKEAFDSPGCTRPVSTMAGLLANSLSLVIGAVTVMSGTALPARVLQSCVCRMCTEPLGQADSDRCAQCMQISIDRIHKEYTTFW